MTSRQSRFRRRMRWILLTAAVLGAVVAALVFEPWKLVVDQRVRKRHRRPPAGPAPVAAGPVVLARGTLISHEHESSGTVALLRLADGSRVLRLEDLRTSNGPAAAGVALRRAGDRPAGGLDGVRRRSPRRPRRPEGQHRQLELPDPGRRRPHRPVQREHLVRRGSTSRSPRRRSIPSRERGMRRPSRHRGRTRLAHPAAARCKVQLDWLDEEFARAAAARRAVRERRPRRRPGEAMPAPALGGMAGSGEHGEQPTGGGEPSVEGVAAELADAVRRRPSDGSRRDRILDWIGDTPIMHGESERPVPVASGDPRRMPCLLSDMYCLCGPPRNT